MPVIKCPECEKVISDKLEKCPNCGCKISKSIRYSKFYEHTEENLSFQNNANDTKNDTYIPNRKTTLCPKCNSSNITYQREQTANIGAGTNKVIIQQPKKSKGCLYWLIIGWWWKPIYWLFIGWWWKLFFGGRNKNGLNFNASKSINITMAICQSCGHSWKVK